LIGFLPRQEHRPVATQPRSPSEHYRDAERLLTAAESSLTNSIEVNAALLAVAHAVSRPSRRGGHHAASQHRHPEVAARGSVGCTATTTKPATINKRPAPAPTPAPGHNHSN
jgi:hypothetical protein